MRKVLDKCNFVVDFVAHTASGEGDVYVCIIGLGLMQSREEKKKLYLLEALFKSCL